MRSSIGRRNLRKADSHRYNRSDIIEFPHESECECVPQPTKCEWVAQARNSTSDLVQELKDQPGVCWTFPTSQEHEHPKNTTTSCAKKDHHPSPACGMGQENHRLSRRQVHFRNDLSSGPTSHPSSLTNSFNHGCKSSVMDVAAVAAYHSAPLKANWLKSASFFG